MAMKKVISFSLDQKIIDWITNRSIENQSNKSIEVNKLLKRAMKKDIKNEKEKA